MALEWNVEDVKDHEHITTAPKVHADTPDEWSAVTRALAWMTMLVGIPKITEENAEEFCLRMAAYENCFPDSVLRNDEGRIYLTMADVREHIGLWTNASRKTRAQFEKDLIKQVLDHAARTVGRADAESARLKILDRVARARAEHAGAAS